MRIGLNLLYLKPNIAGGGTTTYARGLVREFAKWKDLLQFTLFVNKETHASRIFQGELPTVICPVPAKFRALRYAWEQLFLPIQAQKQRLDLLHSLGYVQPLRLSCKSVVTIYDLNFHNIGYLMSPIRRTVLRHFVSQSARIADHIITVSQFSKDQIVELLSVPPEKVTVIYIAPKKKPLCQVEIEELQRRYGVKQPYILALGSPSPHKNLVNLVGAYSLLKKTGFRELKLVLAGHQPRDGGELYRSVQNSGFGDDIIFTGYVPDEVLTSLYLNAEIFVFPSLYEGFGMPVLEAFQYGTPVVCSNIGALREIAGDAALYFDPKSVEGIAECINNLLTRESERQSLVRKGYNRVKMFTWKRAAKETLKVFEKVYQGG